MLTLPASCGSIMAENDRCMGGGSTAFTGYACSGSARRHISYRRPLSISLGMKTSIRGQYVVILRARGETLQVLAGKNETVRENSCGLESQQHHGNRFWSRYWLWLQHH
jgi:hypothetical protein